MVSKLLVGSLLALLVSACGNTPVDVTPQDQGETAAAVQSDEANGADFETAKLRAHRGKGRIERFDANKDGVLQKSEVPERLQAWFTAVDANKDNVVTRDEIRAWHKAHPHQHHHHGQQQQQQHASETTL